MWSCNYKLHNSQVTSSLILIKHTKMEVLQFRNGWKQTREKIKDQRTWPTEYRIRQCLLYQSVYWWFIPRRRLLFILRITARDEFSRRSSPAVGSLNQWSQGVGEEALLWGSYARHFCEKQIFLDSEIRVVSTFLRWSGQRGRLRYIDSVLYGLTLILLLILKLPRGAILFDESDFMYFLAEDIANQRAVFFSHLIATIFIFIFFHGPCLSPKSRASLDKFICLLLLNTYFEILWNLTKIFLIKSCLAIAKTFFYIKRK